jgi:hypothetical protein
MAQNLKSLALETFYSHVIVLIEILIGACSVKMAGQQIKERLERDLGFETNRARMLVEETASSEIATYWKGRNFPSQDGQVFTGLAKAALVAGVAGRQKLIDSLSKVLPVFPKNEDPTTVANEIFALVLDHQATLNLSRHRASCVNAHLNILEPERALNQIYSGHLSEAEMKKAKRQSLEILKLDVTNSSQFLKWISDVNDLLYWVSDDSLPEAVSDLDSSVSKKGLISRKAMSTYQKQWELFGKEKLGPLFGLIITEDDVSPLSGKLNNLEKGASRSWTTIAGDITEAKTSTAFQKRISTLSERGFTTSFISKNLDNFDLELSGRPLKIQISSDGVTKDHLTQFTKAMKAQFVAYDGKGQFNVSVTVLGKVLSVSLLNASKSDLNKVEDMILELI